MLIFKKVADLRQWLAAQTSPIGFAPTMGALHAGHLELIQMAKQDGCVAVASIFVNPTQFNDPKDLLKYPRTAEKDIQLLHSVQCDALFMPPVEEVYPADLNVHISLDFNQLDKVMEGKFRPGHFQGMATVVNRLLDIVRPRYLYMGQKDYQQLSIVREMIEQLQLPVNLIMCPTVRESDGLAMSSRNTRLDSEMRAAAPLIYQTLLWAKTAFEADMPAADIQTAAMHRLQQAGLRPEYFDLMDGSTLIALAATDTRTSLTSVASARTWVSCVAAFAGEVRLIDNLILHP